VNIVFVQTYMNVSVDSNTRAELIKFANVFWKLVKHLTKHDEAYKALSETERMEYFHKDKTYWQFINDFGIVVRFMVCEHSYSKRAFRLLLTRLYNEVEPPMNERERGYTMDKYCRDSAYYYRCLYKFSSKKHNVTNEELDEKYEEAYELLKQEHKDFRVNYRETKKAVACRKVTHRGEKMYDILLAACAGRRQIPEHMKSQLIMLAMRQMRRKGLTIALGELLQVTPRIPCSAEGVGTGPEMNDRPRPVVRMVETVDPARMSEIPKHLVVDSAMQWGLGK